MEKRAEAMFRSNVFDEENPLIDMWNIRESAQPEGEPSNIHEKLKHGYQINYFDKYSLPSKKQVKMELIDQHIHRSEDSNGSKSIFF